MSRQRKTKKLGRPPLPKGQAKGRIVPMRLTSAEAASFVKAAKARKQTLSEWIRSTLHAAIEG